MKMKKNGFTLIEVMIVVAIIGILAAIAIPNFLKFQARSKQGEAKANLKSFFTTQKSYFQEHDVYLSDAAKIGFAPERGNRYGYYFGANSAAFGQDRTGVTVGINAGVPVACISVDTFKFGGVPFPVYGGADMTGFSTIGGANPPPGSPGGVNGGCPNCEMSAVAAANLDNDTAGIDSWYIATKDASGAGTNCNSSVAASAGVPYNSYNDVECP